MVGARTRNAVLGLVASLALSAALWVYFDIGFAFLFVPFVPYLLSRSSGDEGRPPVRGCPHCDFRTRDPEFDYCPRDGAHLSERDA